MCDEFLSILRWRSFTVLGTKVASSFSLVIAGSGFHSLRGFFFFFSFISFSFLVMSRMLNK
jgi:hypothetical protein